MAHWAGERFEYACTCHPHEIKSPLAVAAYEFSMLKVKLDANIRIGRDALYPLPPELVGLLRSIRQHGSLAIREVGISYRHAWGLLGRWEAITGHKLAILTRGQGTGLTPFGVRFADIGE